MKKITKILLRLSSLFVLSVLVFFGGLVSKFTQEGQQMKTKGNPADRFSNPFDPQFAHADFIGPGPASPSSPASSGGPEGPGCEAPGGPGPGGADTC